MIANLRAVLGLNSKGFKAGVRGADREAQSFRQRISGIGKAIGIAFSVGAVLNFGKSLVSWSSEIVHAARNANLFTSEMMAVNRVVEAAGGTTREAQNIFARFSAEVGEAIFEGKELKQAYLDLGLSVENLAGRDDMERLRMLARAIRDSENPTRTLVSLFGIRGANMRASFEAIAEGIDDISSASARGAEKAERLATAFGKFWDNVKAQTVGVLDYYFGENEIMKASRDVTRHMEREQQKRAELAAQRDAAAARQKQIEEDRAKAVAAEWAGLVELDRQNKVLAESRLQGLEKMEAEHERAQEQIREQMERSTDIERDLLGIRSDMLKKHYEEDVAAFKQAEQEKAAAETDRVKKSLQQQIDRATERGQAEISRARGAGVQADALAQHGGFMGGGRSGLAMEDRTLKVNTEQLRVLSEIKPLIQRMKEIAEMESDVAGGL